MVRSKSRWWVWSLPGLAMMACHAGQNTAPHAPLVEPQAAATTTLAPSSSGQEGCGLPSRLADRGWPRVLEPTAEQEPTSPSKRGVTIAILPDTQYYVSCREAHFARQTRYVAAEIETRNIVAAIQLGDLTEHNTEAEWNFVVDALAPLRDRLPLFLASGNHDYGRQGSADSRSSLFGRYFSNPGEETRKATVATLRPGDWENAYFRFPVKATNVGVMVLEWSPRTETVRWAKGVFEAYPDDRVIFVTHAYLYYDDTRYDWASKGDQQEWNPRTYATAKKDPTRDPGDGNWAEAGAFDGEMLWQELLKDHPGLFLTLNGHVLGDGTGLLSERGTHGNLVHQVLANYQMLDEGGLGYLRLMELAEDGKLLTMKTYSPSLALYATASDQFFSVPLDPPLF